MDNAAQLKTNSNTKTSPDNNALSEEKRKIKRDRADEAISNLKNSIPDIDTIFDIHGRVGNGTFSTVFLASMKSEQDMPQEKRKFFAIKHLIPTSHPNRIIKELKCLVEIGGADNIAGINLCLRRNENVAFVMPYVAHDRFQDFYDKITITEIQAYIRNLLIALRRVHNFKIIHRDIKPSNFLYNRKSGQCVLVDFGLAQTVIRSQNVNEIELKRKLSVEEVDLSGQGDSKKTRTNTAQINSADSPLKMPLKQVNEISPISGIVKSCAKNSLGDKSINRVQDKVRNNTQVNRDIPSTSQNPPPNTANNKSSPGTKNNNNKCTCNGKGQVCNTCLIRKEVPASRAGTPGYRPPEVLLKYADQTCAVDIWAVGVIFISILSGVYPFFKAPDDFVALAEIVMLFGDDRIRKTAMKLNRNVTMSRKCKPLNLRKLCVRLKNRASIDRSEVLKKYQNDGKKCEECVNCQQMFFDCLCENTKYITEPIGRDHFPDSAYDFLNKLLEVNPHKRITAEKALEHDFLNEIFN